MSDSSGSHSHESQPARKKSLSAKKGLDLMEEEEQKDSENKKTKPKEPNEKMELFKRRVRKLKRQKDARLKDQRCQEGTRAFSIKKIKQKHKIDFKPQKPKLKPNSKPKRNQGEMLKSVQQRNYCACSGDTFYNYQYTEFQVHNTANYLSEPYRDNNVHMKQQEREFDLEEFEKSEQENFSTYTCIALSRIGNQESQDYQLYEQEMAGMRVNFENEGTQMQIEVTEPIQKKSSKKQSSIGEVDSTEFEEAKMKKIVNVHETDISQMIVKPELRSKVEDIQTSSEEKPQQVDKKENKTAIIDPYAMRDETQDRQGSKQEEQWPKQQN